MSQGRRPLQPLNNSRQFMYSNPSVPTYRTIWGYGNKANGRADLRPTQKRILIDGTTSTVGNYYHVATWAAAKAIFASGDWILFPGGSTGTVELAELAVATVPMSGTSMVNMTVIGTFDPSNNTNSVNDEQYYNTKRYTFNMAGKLPGFEWAYYTRPAPLNYIAFVNFIITANTTDSSIKLTLFGGGTGVLFENISTNVFAYNIQGTSNLPAINVACSSITSSGTTATAFTATTTLLQVGNQVGIGYTGSSAGSARATTSLTSSGTTATLLSSDTSAFNVGGKIKVFLADQPEYNGTFTVSAIVANVSVSYTFAGSATPTATWNSTLYNGILYDGPYTGPYTITAVNPGVSFQFTFPGNNNVACTGTPVYCIPVADVPASYFMNTVEFRFCGTMYGNDLATGNGGNLYTGVVNGIRRAGCVDFHGGWSKNQTRMTAPWGDPGLAITSLTSVGTVATAATANTYSLAIGDYASILGATPAAYNGNYVVTAVVPNTSFSYTFAGTGNASATGTLTWGGNTTTVASGPDLRKHAQYYDDTTKNIEDFDSIVAWDASNPKITGYGLQMQNCVSWRNPIGLISSSAGNDALANLNGSLVDIRGFLVVHAANINDTNSPRANAVQVSGSSAGSYCQAMIINNDAFGTTYPTTLLANSNGLITSQTLMQFDQCIVYNWGGTVGTTAVDAKTTVTFTNNCWPIASQAGGNVINSAMPANYQTRLAAMAARDIFSLIREFPQYLGSITPVTNAGSLVANQRQTEILAFEYMCSNMVPDGLGGVPVPWAQIIQQHFKSALAGR